MRDISKTNLNKCRITTGKLGSSNSDGNNGAFCIPHPEKTSTYFMVVCSDGKQPGMENVDPDHPWEHVSVHIKYVPKRKAGREKVKNRTPSWIEMDYVKRMFWKSEEVCFQLHVDPAKHINCHPYTLHIWRNTEQEVPQPPSNLVGPETESKENQLNDQP